MEFMTLSEKEIGEKIIAAFNSPFSRMRSINGIARDTGLSADIILEFIKKHPELFKKSPIAPPTGSAIYVYN